MKLKMTALIIGLMAIISSCDDLGLLNYDLEVPLKFTVNATSIADSTYVLESDTVNLAEKLVENSFDPEKIKSAVLKSFIFQIDQPEEGNFNWLESAEISMTAVSPDGQPDIVIATINNVDLEIKEIAKLDLNVDLTEYLKRGSYTFKVQTTTDDIVPVEHKINFTPLYKVEFN